MMIRRSRRSARSLALLAAAALLAGCGGASVSGSAVTGIAFGDSAIAAGALSLADASTPVKVRQVSTRADGSFAVDVDGLTAPFVIKVAWSSSGSTRELYAIAEGAENLDVNPITDLAVAYAAGDATSAATLLAASGADKRRATTQARAILTDLAAEIAPLLLQYGIANLRTDKEQVRQLLQDVTVTSADGFVAFSNKRSGGTIHRVNGNSPRGGSFDGSQLPGGPSSGGPTSSSSGASASSSGSTSTNNLPAGHPSIPSGATCASCHGGGASSGGGATSSSSGATSSSSSGATSSSGPPAPPGTSSSGTTSSSSGPPAPPGTSSSGSTSSSSSGTTSSSSGSTSTDGATLYAAKCASCHGALASSTKRNTTAAAILSFHSNLVTSAQATAIASALSSASSSSSGGTTSSSSGTTSSSGPPGPPGASSSGSTSSSSSGATSSSSSGTASSSGASPAGSACGYGTNTAALAVTSGTRSLTSGAYAASSTDESGVCVVNSGSSLTLTTPTITTTGNTSSSDSSSFYGLNAGALAYTGATLNITGGTITTTGTGANGVFAYGTGVANVSGTTIVAKAQGAHGLMTAGGGTLVAKNVDAETWSTQGSVIATDRGTGNKVTVTGGTFVAHGFRSAGVYSTGDVTVSGAILTSEAAEGVVIEGKNSATLVDCTVTSTNPSEKRGMFVYQSFSGDAAVGKGVLTMKGGSYTWNSSDSTSAAFYSTNTTAAITLDGVKLTNPTGYLLHAQADQWGTSGANGAAVTFAARNQTLRGDLVVDALSSVAASFTSSSSYTGAINAANSGKAVSVALDASSLWTATATSYVHTLSGVVLSGTTVTNIAGGSSANVCYRTSFTDSTGATHTSGTYALKNGGSLKPCS